MHIMSNCKLLNSKLKKITENVINKTIFNRTYLQILLIFAKVWRNIIRWKCTTITDDFNFYKISINVTKAPFDIIECRQTVQFFV
jgi:hypothetical protein